MTSQSVEWKCPSCASKVVTTFQKGTEKSVTCPGCLKGVRVFAPTSAAPNIVALKAVIDPSHERQIVEPAKFKADAVSYGSIKDGGFRLHITCAHCSGGSHWHDIGLTAGQQPNIGSSWGPWVCSSYQSDSQLRQERHSYLGIVQTVTTPETVGMQANRGW